MLSANMLPFVILTKGSCSFPESVQRVKRYERFFRGIYDDFQLFSLIQIFFQGLFDRITSKCSSAVCGCLCGQQMESCWNWPTRLHRYLRFTLLELRDIVFLFHSLKTYYAINKDRGSKSSHIFWKEQIGNLLHIHIWFSTYWIKFSSRLSDCLPIWFVYRSQWAEGTQGCCKKHFKVKSWIKWMIFLCWWVSY